MLFTQSERDDNESRQYPGRQRSLGADNMRDLAYLKLLSREYPNIRAAASDIINLHLFGVVFMMLWWYECGFHFEDFGK